MIEEWSNEIYCTAVTQKAFMDEHRSHYRFVPERHEIITVHYDPDSGIHNIYHRDVGPTKSAFKHDYDFKHVKRFTKTYNPPEHFDKELFEI